ncbi:MAG: hypothetical protein ANABAC_2875 [Anaerolineae bacterium]|nr:MAG: hypothetical protein ANABAC_2875 [Anaerolineae bacterium]
MVLQIFASIVAISKTIWFNAEFFLCSDFVLPNSPLPVTKPLVAGEKVVV